MPTATILTIGNELVSGDVPNTNGSWLAKRLAPLGIETRLPRQCRTRSRRSRSSFAASAACRRLIVTGGLGGTPDDLTREALAYTFDAPQEEIPELAEDLRARFRGDPEYAARWARLPRGARPLRNPLGGAPGFVLENVYVLPGLPSEMEAMFEVIAGELEGGSPIGAWRRTYRTRESVIAPALVEAGERWPGVLVGSYPMFGDDGPTVEVVVKSSDADALRAASEWLALALEERS